VNGHEGSTDNNLGNLGEGRSSAPNHNAVVVRCGYALPLCFSHVLFTPFLGRSPGMGVGRCFKSRIHLEIIDHKETNSSFDYFEIGNILLIFDAFVRTFKM